MMKWAKGKAFLQNCSSSFLSFIQINNTGKGMPTVFFMVVELFEMIDSSAHNL